MRLLLIAAVLPLAACQSNWEKQGSAAESGGADATRNFAASGFSAVDLRGSDDVDVRTGPAFAVVAQGDPKVLDQLDIRVVDGTLRIGRKDVGERALVLERSGGTHPRDDAAPHRGVDPWFGRHDGSAGRG